MNLNLKVVCAATVLALGSALHAEDYMMQKAKVELLVNQAKEFYDDSFRKGSETYGAPYQFYFGLMYATGTNLLARAESSATRQRMQKYCELIEKDYEAYTKVEAAAEKAAATGSDKLFVGKWVVRDGSRHRAKRLINAQKLGDRELDSAIKRWENFASQLLREQKKR